jgi:hypothetical protein
MATVHARPDYAIQPQGEPPPGYPAGPVPDSYQSEPDELTFEQRRAEYLAHLLKNPAPLNTKAAWYELTRQAGGGRPHEGVIRASLEFIAARKDCADFALHAVLRLLYGERQPTGGYSAGLLAQARQTVLGFKYFPNEPGVDSLCTWTENHYILYTSAAYLAGQLYPDEAFSNSGETGREKLALNRPRLLRWLELRFRTGFSEWLSHVYYDEDLAALLSLVDLAEDEEIARKAEMVLDLLLLDMALNSFRGDFGSTHGRAYENTKKQAADQGTAAASKLLFGMGVYSTFDSMSGPALALSRYRVPPAVAAAARDTGRVLENRQRMGIRLSELQRWGLRPDNFEDGMHCLTLEAYTHPRTIANTLRMFDTCGWWENSFLSAFKPYHSLLRAARALGALPWLAGLLERDVCRNTREEVNLYTYRTPEYMLSTAQDYRKGYGGDQQHIWQASLGEGAVCFTTHPARLEGVTPNYWEGSGLLPRAAQHRNVSLILYRIKKIPALYVPVRHFYTHAWLPKDQFDEVVERQGWVFARKGDGYLALRSQHPYFWNSAAPGSEAQEALKAGLRASDRWREHPEDREREIIVPGAQNAWICQMGRRADDCDFAAFMEEVCRARLEFQGLRVTYAAPGLGELRFDWEGPLILDGAELPLAVYPRYANPYCQAEFDPQEIHVRAGGEELRLNRKTGAREISRAGITD